MVDEYKRVCPECNKEILYSLMDNLKRAEKANSVCKSCSKKGKKFSDEHKEKLRESRIGRKNSLISRLKNSKTQKQRFIDNPELRKKASETSKRILHQVDIRKKHIEALSKTRWLGKTFDKGQLEMIEKWNQLGFHFEPNFQLHTNNFLCYVDGYDKEKNVVLEYDGKYHTTLKQQKKDLIRQQKIIDILKPKKFWRYDLTNKSWKDITGV